MTVRESRDQRRERQRVKRRVLRLPAVQEKTGKTRSAIYGDMKLEENPFPKPVRLGERAVGWLEHEIDAWLDRQIAKRDATNTVEATIPETTMAERPRVRRRGGDDAR